MKHPIILHGNKDSAIKIMRQMAKRYEKKMYAHAEYFPDYNYLNVKSTSVTQNPGVIFLFAMDLLPKAFQHLCRLWLNVSFPNGATTTVEHSQVIVFVEEDYVLTAGQEKNAIIYNELPGNMTDRAAELYEKAIWAEMNFRQVDRLAVNERNREYLEKYYKNRRDYYLQRSQQILTDTQKTA